jgi:hypothetical protein
MRLSYRAAGLALIILVLSACGTVTGGAKIDELETKNAQLQATIDIVGTPVLTIMALEQYATQNVVLQARLSQAENESLAARATLTVLELSSGMAVAQPTPAAPNVTADSNNPPNQSTPLAPEAAPSPTSPGTANLTQFSQTVTASDRDQQDCPVGITSTFSPDTDTIYVNTQINYLPAGSTLSARWTVNGQLYFDDVECWIPNQDYFNICAWCSIAPESGLFDTGEWSVELMLNGQTMAQTNFQVVDSTQQGGTGTQNQSTNPKGN